MLKIIIPSSSWITLGFYRGINAYNSNYKKEYNRYEKNKKYNIKPEYFYFQSICSGIFGIIIYINPFTVPFVIPKELYRLEVNIRSLDNEKENENYNNIW